MSVATSTWGQSIGLRNGRFFWNHPEWWVYGLIAVAWGIIIPHAIAHHGHVLHMMSFGEELLAWCLMAVGMMVPSSMLSLRRVAFQSFRARRHLAILLFLVGFLAPWSMIGVAAAWLRTLPVVHSSFLAADVFALAGLWTLAPLRKRLLTACHKTMPLAPNGRRANVDCLRYGGYVGSACVGTCGLLMLACTLTGHDLVAMLAGAGLGAVESRSFRPPVRLIGAGVLLLSIWFLTPLSYAMYPGASKSMSCPDMKSTSKSSPHCSMPGMTGM